MKSHAWKAAITALLAAAAASGGASPVGQDDSVQGASAAASPPLRIWRPGRQLDFRPLSEMMESVEIQLSNGITVQLADWPSVFISSTEEGSCTSTLVGPNTVLTAAHCVDSGLPTGALPTSTLGGRVMIGGAEYRLTCLMHPSYASAPLHPEGGVRTSQDFALCLLDRPVDPTTVRPETIDLVHVQAPPAAILMTGYGCTNIRVSDAGRLLYRRGDGQLRMNDEQIHQSALRAGPEPVGVWLSTLAATGEPTLCPGDSGGPVVTGATLANQTPSRRMVAVNSAVGWERRPAGGWDLYSYMAPLATDDFRTFVALFVQSFPSAIICGHNRPAGSGGCRA